MNRRRFTNLLVTAAAGLWVPRVWGEGSPILGSWASITSPPMNLHPRPAQPGWPLWTIIFMYQFDDDGTFTHGIENKYTGSPLDGLLITSGSYRIDEDSLVLSDCTGSWTPYRYDAYGNKINDANLSNPPYEDRREASFDGRYPYAISGDELVMSLPIAADRRTPPHHYWRKSHFGVGPK